MGLALAAGAGAGPYKVYTTYLWHLQQPIYWPEPAAGLARYQFAYESLAGSATYPGHPQNNLADIFGLDDRKAAYQFRPRDAVGAMSRPDAGAQVSYAGSLIENVWSLGDHYSLGYTPTWYAPFREAMGWKTTRNRRKLEPVGFAYHHAFMPLIDRDARRMEIEINKHIWWKAWGGQADLSDHPKGFRCSEEAFSVRMIRELVEAGYEWVIVPNHHLARTHPNYVQLHGSGVYDPPNRADQVNAPNAGVWYSGTIDGRGSTESVPFSFQAHRAKCVDPDTGQAYTIVVVPMTDLGSYRDGFSAQGLDLPNLLHRQADPAQPCLALFSHDGDNAWGGGYSYYMEAVPSFVSQVSAAGYRPTTIQTFLDENPPPANDVVHVEDGAWVNAENDWGHPLYVNWLWPPQRNRSSPSFNANDPATYADIEGGWAEDFRNWAVIVAAQNFVSTALQVHTNAGGTFQAWKAQEPVQRSGTDNGANAAELAWHYFLASLDSGYMYYGASIDMEVKPSLACNRAIEHAQAVLGAHDPADDRTGPTVFNPQRYPWNPGATNYGAIIGYRRWVAPSDFHVWTLAYDVSGVTSCVLKVRADADGFNPVADDANEVFAGSPAVGAWQTIPMTRRPGTNFAGNIFGDPNIDFFIMPTHIADEYWAKVTGYDNVLLDYYVEAADARGNVKRSDIQHVYVGAAGGGTPVTFTPAAPRTCDDLVTRYHASGRPLAAASPVYLHLTFDHFATITNLAMASAGGSAWVATNDIPPTATNAVVYFSDTNQPGAGLIDNNSNANWSVAVAACPVYIPPAVGTDPAAPNGCVAVTIRYAPNSGVLSGASPVHIHLGRNGWQDLVTGSTAMTLSGTNWTYTYATPPGTRAIDFVFHNGAGVWDNNDNQDWHVAVENCSGGQTSAVPRLVPGSPVISPDPASGQNNAGDRFDFDLSGGDAVTVDQGGFGSFGHVYLNYDASNLYVGAVGCQVAGSNNALAIFLGVNTRADDASVLWYTTGLPRGLDQLHNVLLDPPMDLALLLGDEYGDAAFPDFQLGHGYPMGQGAWYLGGTGAFASVPGVRVSQFDGTGTNATASADDDGGDRLTDRWECAIPWSSLDATGVPSLTHCRLAGLLISSGTNGNDRYLSGNYLGLSATNDAPRDGAGNFAWTFVTLHALDVDLPGTDADGDGLPDAWEQRFFGGPTNAVAGADADGDGFDNAAEFRLGTHPRSAASGLWLTGVAPAAGGRGVTWRSVGGRQYRVDAAPDVGMAFTNVALVAEDDVPGDTETEETYADTNAPASPTRSYRVRLAP